MGIVLPAQVGQAPQVLPHPALGDGPSGCALLLAEDLPLDEPAGGDAPDCCDGWRQVEAALEGLGYSTEWTPEDALRCRSTTAQSELSNTEFLLKRPVFAQ
jgi:hypothetical protein